MTFTPETLATATPLGIPEWLHEADPLAQGVNDDGFVKWTWKDGVLLGSRVLHRKRRRSLGCFLGLERGA